MMPATPRQAKLVLPLPPSLNQLYANSPPAKLKQAPTWAAHFQTGGWVAPGSSSRAAKGGQRGRFKTKIYKEWLTAAGWQLKTQGPLPRFTSLVTIDVLLKHPNFAGPDMDNFANKAIFDLLVRHQIIADDSDVLGGKNLWGPGPEDVVVTITGVPTPSWWHWGTFTDNAAKRKKKASTSRGPVPRAMGALPEPGLFCLPGLTSLWDHLSPPVSDPRFSRPLGEGR